MLDLSAVNTDLELSSADLETEDAPAVKVLVPAAKNDSETLSINVPRETMSAALGVELSDPVADAVATAVEQWVGFDPAVHSVNPDGTPRLRVDGSYARKRGKGGRKSGPDDTSGSDDLFGGYETVSPGSTVLGATPQSVPNQTAPNMSSAQAATMLVIACTTVMGKLVGPEWHAEKPEQKALAEATKIYLDSKGGLNVTPEMGLFIAISMYAVPRLAHENTRSKFGLLVDWTRDRIAVLRARFGR